MIVTRARTIPALRSSTSRIIAPRLPFVAIRRWKSGVPPTNAPLSPEQERLEAEKQKALEAGREERRRLHEIEWDAPIISYDQLKPKTLSPNPDSFLIDVREPDETIQGMIPSAVNIPLSTFNTDIRMDSVAFKNKFGFNLPRKDQEVTFYCRSGKRSSTASDSAKRAGYTNILNYKGSWLEWVEKEGKPQ
ncbi:endoplasmic reticulum protein [Flagelloscypha sp. PMI_526]|nr:endoplasmic reticulum protein [Flagelloscypha sp. PMI_526]